MTTGEYRKPLPATDEDSEPFWQALRRHEFTLKRCQDCGRFHHPPRQRCPHCWSLEVEWVPASGRGVLYSYTIAYRAGHPAFAEDTPYVIALIDLEEGVRFISNLVDWQAEALQIGAPLEVVFEDATEDISLPKFRMLE